MTWVEDAAALARAGEPFVVVTVIGSRGHVPRPPGSKLLVTAKAARGSIGGGALELEAIERARRLRREGTRAPQVATVSLTARASGGVQACGGEVTLLTIGSRVKWATLAAELRQRGFAEADLERVTVPIGLPGVPGRSPEAIAIATAAQLLAHLDPEVID